MFSLSSAHLPSFCAPGPLLRRRISLPTIFSEVIRHEPDDRWAWLDLSDSRSRATSASSPSDRSSELTESGSGGDRPSLPSTAPTTTHFNKWSIPVSHIAAHAHRSYPSFSYSKNRDRFHRSSSVNRTLPSANVYIRPLPTAFTDFDLEGLCKTVVSQPGSSVYHHHKILSVKVMIEEEDDLKIGVCKGYGFCLWNSIEAASLCIEGLRAEGYQASFARETSRGMLSSLADPSSANVYLSNLPHHWVEQDLMALFGHTPISSIRLLRDRDNEAVGSGVSRGVGFVRLVSRKEALHFVEKLHGSVVDGTDHHIQCRMADSKAQKEWKRTARSRHDHPPVNAYDLKNNPRRLEVKIIQPASRWACETKNHQTPELTSKSTYAASADAMTKSNPRGSGLPKSPQDRVDQTTSLVATTPPFVMPHPRSMMLSPLSAPPSFSNSSIGSPVSCASAASVAGDPYHFPITPSPSPGTTMASAWYQKNDHAFVASGPNFMSYSHASFIGPPYSQIDPGHQTMPLDLNSTPFNVFHVSGNPHYHASPHDPQLYCFESPRSEPGPYHLYATGNEHFRPTPVDFFEGPTALTKPDPGFAQEIFQIQGDTDSDSWDHSESDKIESPSSNPLQTATVIEQ